MLGQLKIELVRIRGRNIVTQTWPNDYNIMLLPLMLQEKFGHIQILANNTQYVATCRNISQYVATANRVGKRTYTTCCSQQSVARSGVSRWDRLAGH